ncbi:hypothetical protein FRX31_032861 [Thalictrum thalictroides]|uniref:Uncharacterized protein n=1 Tax=Thalictrum thalictroides TaxID=46969 RepID=A0A7J6UZP7_THATH|nr:hypothetical protein FRX31_032861 [Thalictrum thalictroides]
MANQCVICAQNEESIEHQIINHALDMELQILLACLQCFKMIKDCLGIFQTARHVLCSHYHWDYRQERNVLLDLRSAGHHVLQITECAFGLVFHDPSV